MVRDPQAARFAVENLLESDRVGAGASGRNGGFVIASLTHGLANGLARFPGEVKQPVRIIEQQPSRG